MLVYGIDIGHNEDWFGTLGPMRKTDYGEELAVDWYDDENYEQTFAQQLIWELAQRCEGSACNDDDEAEKFVTERLGVRIVEHGHYEYVRWLLAPVGEQFELSTGGDWGIRVVSATELLPPGMIDGGEKLARALGMLGLTTSRPPAWLLVADYG
jgi:hypothetical protein